MNKEFFTAYLCLSDIPKENIKIATNGKKYLNIIIAEMPETDNFGNTHAVSVSVPKEDRTNGIKPILLGKAKKYNNK